MQTFVNYVGAKWFSLSPTVREHIESAGQTFIASFGVSLYASIQLIHSTSDISWALVIAIVLTAVRAGVKVAWVNVIKPWILSFFPASTTDAQLGSTK